MYRLKISRQYYRSGTNGTMSYRGKEICKCIELPRNGNSRYKCLPEGEYVVLIRKTPDLGLHLWIAGVSDRKQLLVSSDYDTLLKYPGSIVPIEFITGEGKGTNAGSAMDKLLKVLLPDLYKSKPVTIFIISKSSDHEIKASSEFGGHNRTLSAGQ